MTKNLSIIFIFYFLVSCVDNDNTITKNVIEKYSDKEINLFYEACFNTTKGDASLVRWDGDINYIIEKDFCINDASLVEDVVNEFNSFNLPVSIRKAAGNEANLVISFVSRDKVSKDMVNSGKASLSIDDDNHIYSCEIKIDKDVEPSKKKDVLVHEFFHMFGSVSHVTSDASSVIYPYKLAGRYEGNCIINTKDKKILKMLYNNNWPKRYSKHDFEKSFSELLYNIGKVEKLKNFALSNKQSFEFINYVIDNEIFKLNVSKEEGVYKLPNNIPVSYEGAIPCFFKDTLKATISHINNISDNVQLEFAPELHNRGGGIRFYFEQGREFSQNKIIIDSVMFNGYSEYEINTINSVNLHVSGDLTEAISSKYIGTMLFSAICN
ncbi:MAG: hypothetical protein ACOCP4_07770, partial [Candidatus Woesearchaeota archaeon]